MASSGADRGVRILTTPAATVGPAGAAAESWVSRLPLGLILAALALAGLVIRVVFFHRYQIAGSDCDGAGYMDVARHIAAGDGFMTGVFKDLFLPPIPLPQPDAHWNPLYPLLTAGAFRLAGESISVAKLVPLAFGVAMPPLAFLLAESLTANRTAAWIAGFVAVVHPTLVTWSLRLETEICTMALVTAAFVLILRDGRRRAAALGVVLGLAFLMKYQTAILWPALVFHDLSARGVRRGLRELIPVAIGFAVTIAPWLARNALAFGNPFYTDLRYEALVTYAGFGPNQRFWASSIPPPPFGPWMLGHPLETLRHVLFGVRMLAFTLPHEAMGSVWLVPLGLLGVARIWPRRRQWGPVVVYALLLLLMFTLTTAYPRYLYSLIPFWIALTANGAQWLVGRVSRLKPAPRRALAMAVAVVLAVAMVDQVRTAAAWALDRTSPWNPDSNFCALQVLAAAPYIRANVPPGEPVFAPEPYHAAYLLRRPVVNVPFDEADLAKLRDEFGIHYLIIADRDVLQRLPAWRTQSPPWAVPVWRSSAEEIAQVLRAPDYPHLSPVTIYRLEAGR